MNLISSRLGFSRMGIFSRERCSPKNYEDEGKEIEESVDGEPLLISSALQYFSNLQNAVVQKFKDHDFSNS